MSTKNCKHCQSEIDKKAKVCPVCKKKQGGIIKFIIIGIIVIFIIAALVNGGDDEPKLVETPNNTDTEDTNDTTNNSDTEDTNDKQDTTTDTPVPEKTSFSAGETAELKDVYVTLIGVTESQGSEFNKPEEGNVFAFAEFEIENNSDKEITVSSMMSFESYVDSYSTSLSFSALIEKGEKNQLDGTIGAGKKMNGVIAYEIPSDWSELEIQFTPDFWTNKKIVFIATK